MNSMAGLADELTARARWRDYLELCKPRVVLVMLITATVGMLLADAPATPLLLLLANIGIGLCAGGAATVNHVIDRHLDARMQRTRRRPVAAHRISSRQAMTFAALLGGSGLTVLLWATNPMAAALTLASLLGYALVYTAVLKHATPQNIVIGGLAGAMPPLLGWVAVSGRLDVEPLLLVIIVYLWTPPHFWSLCLHKKDEYAAAGVPMLPVTHGEAHTRLQIVLYGVLLCIATLWPYLLQVSGALYLVGVLALNARLLWWLLRLTGERPGAAIGTFVFSIRYILLLFALLLVDRYLPVLLQHA